MRRRVAIGVLLASATTAGCYAHERDPLADAGAPLDASVAADTLDAPDAHTPTDAHVLLDAASVLDVGLDGGACRTIRADEWIAPAVVRVGDPVPVLMRANAGVSCGCVPRGELETPGGPIASFLACDCSDLDPCVDPGYDATVSAIRRPRPGSASSGTRTAAAGSSSRSPTRRRAQRRRRSRRSSSSRPTARTS